MAEILPVHAILPQLLATLHAHDAAVLIAPPGAGKTTIVPPALLEAPWRGDGRIIVVEPRRLAARAAASRIAANLGEDVGKTIGYRVRNETRVSRASRVELVTAGVFVRMILDNPALEGIAAVIFDEVHERAVDMDLALGLCLDTHSGLRDDLRLIAMSATLDGRRFADLFGNAPIIESEGRLFPVETIYAGSDSTTRIEDRVVRVVRKALIEQTGSILAFLPGQAEISRTAERLASCVTSEIVLAPLYGAMDSRAQDAAIRPAPPGVRKIVLATSIAETSLTIEGVSIVIDSGLARRPRYFPGSGLSRLETVRVSRAAADQRRGRAGRTAPGICYRLWEAPQTAALSPYDRPEILETDLSPLALTLLAWGVADPSRLRWLDPPPAASYAEALDLLDRLGARDSSGRLSPPGRRLADLPLAPRLAHMVLEGAARGDAKAAADIAALLSEPGLGGRETDLRHRLEGFRREQSQRAKSAREAAARWSRLAGEGKGANKPPHPEERAQRASKDAPAGAGTIVVRASRPPAGAPQHEGDWVGSPGAHWDEGAGLSRAGLDPGALLALAFPERLAEQRGARGRFRMANGSGAKLDEADPLASEPFLAIGEVQGGGPDSRILLAAPIDRPTIEALFPDRIRTEETLDYDAAVDAVRAFRIISLDALVLARSPIDAPRDERTARLLVEAALSRGLPDLPWSVDLASMRDRIAFLRRHDPTWPDLSDAALVEHAGEWLLPAFSGKRRLADLSPGDLRNGFAALLPWSRMAELERLAPADYSAPSGRAAPIDYSSGEPIVRLAVQNLFGLAKHPTVLDGRVPILFELLSPAARPIQVTRDLPGFWKGSWRDVRAEMRGRYPKHSWPEDPAAAEPTSGAKRRR